MITLINESMQHYHPDSPSKKVILSAVHHVYQGDETRNEVEVQIIEESQIGRDVDEDISFDTEVDDSVSLNSIHSSSFHVTVSSVVENTETIGLVAVPYPQTPVTSNASDWKERYDETRDEFLLAATGVERGKFFRAISSVPEDVLSLAATAYIHGLKTGSKSSYVDGEAN